MAEEEFLLLTDKEIYPADEYIFSLLGDKKILWQSIMNHMTSDYKDSLGQWNFYNDGKRWLFKMVLKKKTVFWAGLLNDTFRITFYFGDKAEALISDRNLPQKIIDDFKKAKKYGLIRPVSIKVNDQADVDNVLKLIAIKHNLK
jgi:Protein of unknown function (DUF3788)